MNAIKQARKFIQQHPEQQGARVLANLVLALESDNHSFDLSTLYQLDYDTFNLAMQVLQDWRLDRYYAGKAKLFDLSLQIKELTPVAAAAVAAT